MIEKPFSFLIMVGLWILVCTQPVFAGDLPFNETIGGDRNLGQSFSWTVNNASGLADCVYHYAVYDYRDIGENYTYYSPAWGQWFTQSADPGKKYVAIWIRGWLEGTAWFGYGQDRFPVWVWDNMTVQPEPVHMQDLEIGHKGSGRKLPAVIANIENRISRNERGLLTSERYGWKDEIEFNRMEPGRSNAFEGYALYQVPVRVRPDEIRVSGWFGYWGTAVWHLSNITIDQDSIEKQILLEKVAVLKERIEGVRLSDRMAGRGKA